MTFEDVWRDVRGLPNTAMVQAPRTLKEETKRKLAERNPEDVLKIVADAIEDINHGSVVPLDELIRKRL